MEVLFKIFFYATHVLKGFFEIIIGKEEYIHDSDGNIISKLPSKRKQVLVFAKNFLKEPVSSKLLRKQLNMSSRHVHIIPAVLFDQQKNVSEQRHFFNVGVCISFCFIG